MAAAAVRRVDRELRMAYDTEQWHDLFVMTGGAAAALAGLIFVAVSVNFEHILGAPALPALAAQTLSLLIGLVLLSAFGLAPGQSLVAFGIESIVLGAALALLIAGMSLRTRSERLKLQWQASRLALGGAACVPAIVGGVSLIVGAGGGIYWLLAEFVSGLVVAAYYAWILLIEIRR